MDNKQLEQERQIFAALNSNEPGRRFVEHLKKTYVNTQVIGDDPFDTYRRVGRRDFALFIVEMAEKHSG